MISEGDAAPEFTLPAVIDSDFEEVALADYLGDDIVILAFYPADFNPSCSGETTDLDELDLFTMQKDVSILGISADSIYSHRAFAERYDLHVPLLSDVRGEVATDYGVAVEDPNAGHLVNRAVVVISPGGEVEYAWQTDDLNRLPPVDDVRRAVEDIGGGSTARARYRVGHAHYVEGRRAFTMAMGAFEEMEWMMAQGDFARAQGEFEEAADQFNTAVRFAEDDKARTYFERAERKAQALWQAAEWLTESAGSFASGEGTEGEKMRSDAESPLESAREIHEPPDPDDFPPEEDPAEKEETEEASILPTSDDVTDTSLDTDLDGDGDQPDAREIADEMTDDSDAGTGTEEEADDEIDDEELEEIAAELEEQTKKAQQERESESEPESEEDTDTAGDKSDSADETDATAGDDAADEEEKEDELEEEDIELDLADPTEGKEINPDDAADLDEDEDEEKEEDEDLGDGSHGVPDSL